MVGWLVPITKYIDIDRNPTDDPQKAYSVVAGPTRDGQWIASVVTNNEREKLREHIRKWERKGVIHACK